MSSLRSSRFSRLIPFGNRSRSSTSAQPQPSDASTQQTIAASPASNAAPEPFPQGLEIVAEGVDPVVDIVAVHGLNGHRDKTWTANNGIQWLRDLLPDDIPRARILCWGYDANTHSGSPVSRQYLYDHARNLISDLCRKRKLSSSMERPIIFVAHSLGGIVVKSALIHSDAARRGALEEHRSIKVSTYGIVFLGTPHQGGNGVQLGRLLVNIASIFVAADDRILRHLERDSEWLQQQLGQYGPIGGDFVTKFAFEEYKTPTVLGHSIIVVPRASAVVPGQADAEPIAIHADHINMVKYTSRHDSGYNTISEHLQIMADAAAEEIRQRWEAERRANEARSESSGAAFTIGFSLSEVTEVHHFVAREEELTQIHKILGEGSGRRTVVVQGLGGMGKTQLAAAYAERHRDDYSAVLWLNARDETSLKQGFVRVAERILREHPSVAYVKNALESRKLDDAVRAVNQWLDNSKNSRWLIVYDNYDNPMLGSDGRAGNKSEADGDADGDVDAASTGYDIQRFLPHTHHGAVLITTRSRRVEIGHRVTLGRLKNLKDGLDVLSSTSNRQELDKDPAAIKLAEKLDGLPLALSTAGAYLSNMATTFDEYLRMYETSWLRLHMRAPGLPSYDRALYSTWDISYAQVERQNTASARLLELWAYFDHEDLWFELLREGRPSGPPWFQDLMDDILEFNEAVRVLCNYGLVEADISLKERGSESGGYGMHSCVHAWTMHVLNKAKNDDMARLAMRCVSLHVPEENEGEYWIVQRRLIRHCARCLAMTMNEVSVAEGYEWILYNLGRLFFDQGRLDDAESMHERSLQGYEKALGRDHISTLDIVNNLGSLYWQQGRLDDAEAIYQRALQGKEKALGRDHISTLDTVNNLGVLYADQGRLDDAGSMYERALQGKEKALGRDHILTLDTVNNLGNLYWQQGRLGDAEAMYERALQGKEKALGRHHTSTLDTVNNLGVLYAGQGRLDDAGSMYERALQGYEKALGHERVDNYSPALNTIENLAVLYAEQGKVSEARALLVRCQAGIKAVLGVQHERYRSITRALELLQKGS